MKTRVLFVCGRNQWRSPTAETIYRDDPRLKVRSAGVNPSARHKLSIADLEWADVVMVMEHKHQRRIRDLYRWMDLPPLKCLDIPDDYGFMDDELVELIQDATESSLKELLS